MTGALWRRKNRMNDEERHEFGVLVAECTPAMLSFAYLLTGSQEAAERALRSALAETALEWRRLGDLSPESHILRGICRHELAWWRRWRWSRERIDVTADPPGPSGAMRRALLEMPAVERAVVALQRHEQLTDPETARVLGCSQRRVRRYAKRADARLRDLLGHLSAAAPEDLEPVGRHRREHAV